MYNVHANAKDEKQMKTQRLLYFVMDLQLYWCPNKVQHGSEFTVG